MQSNLDCLSRLRHKPKEHPTMFPGLRLTAKVIASQFAAQIVGDTFERLTETVAGPKWKRLFPEDDFDIRPDLGTLDGMNFIESKASKDRRYFKIATDQLTAYSKVIGHAKEHRDTAIALSYFLWSYNHDESLSGRGRTISDVIQLVSNGLVQLDIIDWEIINNILKKDPANTQYREYSSWRNTRDSGYKALQISHIFLRRLRENPHNVLLEELDLNPMDYDLRTNYRRRIAKIEVDGVKFKTKKFIINRYIHKGSFEVWPQSIPASLNAVPF